MPDFLDHTLFWIHIKLIVYPLHDEECEEWSGYDAEYDSESHPRPEFISKCDRQYTESRRDSREEHRFETRRSCFDEGSDTFDSFFEILIDRGY